MPHRSLPERFVALVKRELSAVDVRVLGPGEPAPDASNVLSAALPDGRVVVATFAEPPEQPTVVERRFAILATTFDDAFPPPSRDRPQIRVSLHDELRALTRRAHASDAVVIDVDSPVVWGAGSSERYHEVDRALIRERDASRPELGGASAAFADASGTSLSAAAGDDDENDTLPARTIRAIVEVRALPDIDSVKRGRPFRHAVSGGELGYLVLSFAGIYLAVIVFDGDFDELRAERAVQEAIPRIEALVEALPPLDPEPQPMGAVVSMRTRRRR